MTHPTTAPPAAPLPGAALYLRSDGSLLLVRGDAAIEIRMTAPQLMTLATDAFRVAVDLEPALVDEAVSVMAGTTALETAEAPCGAH